LKPVGLTALKWFERTIDFCGSSRNYANKQQDHNSSDTLHVISPMEGCKKHPKDFMRVDYHHSGGKPHERCS